MRKTWCSILACSALLAACSDGGSTKLGDVTDVTGKGGSTGDTGKNGDGDTKPWTIFVYMAIDNNVERYGLADFREMQAGVTDQMNLIVLMDRSAADDPEGGHSGEPIDGIGAFSGARLLRVTPDGITDLKVRGDADMTDPATLSQIGAKVFTDYPAEHTGVVFWDHGGGWYGFGVDDGANGGEGTMSPDELSAGLQGAIDGSGIGKLSMVVFNACLMAELSTASALAPVSDYLLASEELMPVHGLDWGRLGEATSGDAEQFGTTMLDGYQAQSTEMGDVDSVTLSLLDLSKVGAVEQAVGGLTDAIAADPSTSVDLLRAADNATAFQYDPNPANSVNMRDLGQIADTLAKGGSSASAAGVTLLDAVDALVVAHFEGAGYTGARGVAAYVPPSSDYVVPFFTDLTSSAPWTKLLETVFDAGTQVVGSGDTSFVAPPQAQYQDGLLTVAASVDPSIASTIASVTVFYCAFVPAQDGFPDLCLMLGRTSGGVADVATGLVGGRLPVLQLGISADGGSSGLLAVFSPVPSPDGTTTVLSVPIRYIPAGMTSDQGADGYLLLTLAEDGTVAQRAMALRTADGTLAQLDPDPSASIQTVVLQIGADESVVPVLSENYGDPASLLATLDAFTIVAQQRGPGDGSPLGNNLGFGVVITDAAGNTHVTFAKYPA